VSVFDFNMKQVEASKMDANVAADTSEKITTLIFQKTSQKYFSLNWNWLMQQVNRFRPIFTGYAPTVMKRLTLQILTSFPKQI